MTKNEMKHRGAAPWMDRALEAMKIMEEILDIPSPTGYTKDMDQYLMDFFKGLGFKPWTRNKGGVLVVLDPAQDQHSQKADDDAILLAAHIDTLGLMVRAIREKGMMRLTTLGSFPYNYVEQENALLITRDGRRYEGSIHLENPAVHANREVYTAKRSDENVYFSLDEKVQSKEDVKALGIAPGDVICMDPRFRQTASGFVKSRFLDDKASVAMFLVLAKEVAAGRLQLPRKTYLFFSNYEEVGLGACGGMPMGVKDLLAVDMGVVGHDLETDEFKVSICAKDSSGPYNYELTTELLNLAKEKDLHYAIDVYPYYGSDAAVALKEGMDVRHGLIGCGVARSHGYERIHQEGVANTLALLEAYLGAR